MRKLTIKKPFFPYQLASIETTFKVKIPTLVQHYLTEYSGFGIDECLFVNDSGSLFSLHVFIDYGVMYNCMKMFQQAKLGKKIPFALDRGGWTLVVSLDPKTKGQVMLFQAGIDWKNRKDAFKKICDSFEIFINGLKRETETFPEPPLPTASLLSGVLGGCMDYILLKEKNKITNPLLNAKDLLHKIIDLTCLWCFKSPDLQEDQWHLEKNTDCLPRYYRIQEIESLARAFGISKENFDRNNLTKWLQDTDTQTKKMIWEQFERKSPVQFILDGDFLLCNYTLKHYPELLKNVTEYHRAFRPIINVSETEKMNVIKIYTSLLKFRQRIRYEMGTYGLLFEGTALEQTFITYVKSNLNFDFIDNLLVPLLDAQNCQFTRKSLILNDGYPHIDLRIIDFKYYRELEESVYG